MDIAGLVVSGVSALGTLVQAFYSAKSSNQKISKREITKAENRASKPLIIGAKQVGDVIDQELLLALSREIEDHHKALVNAFYNSELTVSEKEIIVESARIQICKFLCEVKNFNNDQLPTERLKKLWESNRCRT
ncbi:hypothetical protein UA32_10875 [Photobacterium angustum]|uniref:Uncharacterized protein n=1 Tax=Photobacterium angustum TaxID=661 RepID=A0ABX5H579_PHOAN|nr:hypothetical protein [Photobacterium angustum]KJG38303.1 hypothetical protein UA32_10875 [Photobacterium angustum]PSX11026.1 hypothetical protein C0W27_07600 [Photobacterium angustum]